MKLNDNTIKSFKKVKITPLPFSPTNLTYHPSGKSLVVSSPAILLIYNPLLPILHTKLNIPNTFIQYNTENTLLVSNKNVTSYLSTYDSTILKTYKAESEIKSLSVSDTDLFMTTSNSVVIRDIRDTKTAYRINAPGCVGTFLKENSFVIGNRSSLRFYDTRNVKGPINVNTFLNVNELRYYRSCDKLLVVTDRGTHFYNEDRFIEDSSGALSSNGEFYLSKGIVKAYSVCKESVVCNFMEKAAAVAFNPLFGQFVVANGDLSYWQPGASEQED